MNINNLPMGSTSFEKIRNSNLIYVDKTEFLYNLLQNNSPYFLSRPAGFGKTLMIDTLECILRGQRELFKGLWIDSSDYNWKPHPVIRLNMENHTIIKKISEVNERICNHLRHAAYHNEGFILDGSYPATVFASYIKNLGEKYQRRVAVLIDNYEDMLIGRFKELGFVYKLGNCLMKFYQALKDTDKNRGFTLIAGISKLRYLPLFSQKNNFVDLNLKKEYASLCGFTLEELDTFFPEHMKRFLWKLQHKEFISKEDTMAKLKQLLVEMYGGYSWDGQTMVLNPWSTLHALNKRKLSVYFNNRKPIPCFVKEQIQTGMSIINSPNGEASLKVGSRQIELGNLTEPIPLMFQYGFLTVNRVKESKNGAIYHLKIPNLEVKAGATNFSPYHLIITNPLVARENVISMLNSLNSLKTLDFEKSLSSLLDDACYWEHDKTREEFYLSYLHSAMFFADAKISKLECATDLRYVFNYISTEGKLFIIKLRSCNASPNLVDPGQCYAYAVSDLINVHEVYKVDLRECFVQREKVFRVHLKKLNVFI